MHLSQVTPTMESPAIQLLLIACYVAPSIFRSAGFELQLDPIVRPVWVFSIA